MLLLLLFLLLLLLLFLILATIKTHPLQVGIMATATMNESGSVCVCEIFVWLKTFPLDEIK